ncbi:hypothetical protein [Butyrivibrio sp. AE3004]|uniref:hypothetical protein n=1 Tax=Butyrivibrio sp. AE3004 TaxID=1506994 RepID=UPI00049455AA|nr:hypothetical protein [Butyrivibrio sp. AE3004]
MRIEDIYDDMRSAINAYINPIDLEIALTQQENFGSAMLKLVVIDKKLIPVLKEIDYTGFLKNIITNLEIEDKNLPVFSSIIDEKLMMKVADLLKTERNRVVVRIDDAEGVLYIESTVFMCNVLYGPIAQIHNLAIEAIANDVKYRNAQIETFPNFKRASALENFVEEWCYEKIFGKSKMRKGMLVK